MVLIDQIVILGNIFLYILCENAEFTLDVVHTSTLHVSNINSV